MSDYRPMRAVLAHRPFSDSAWLYERKFDGIRCGMVRRDGVARLVLERRERPDPPFGADGLPRRARWAAPELVAEIEFTEWTRDGKLRHPRYLGRRHDKPACEVVREEPAA